MSSYYNEIVKEVDKILSFSDVFYYYNINNKNLTFCDLSNRATIQRIVQLTLEELVKTNKIRSPLFARTLYFYDTDKYVNYYNKHVKKTLLTLDLKEELHPLIMSITRRFMYGDL